MSGKPKVCIIGPGIVGKATGIVLAEHGFKVGFIGRNAEKIKKLSEAGFYAYTFESFPNHSFEFDISLITIATPTVDGKINLKPLISGVTHLAKWLKYRKEYHTVVVKSTVPPGTTEEIVKPIIEKYSGKKVGRDIGLCMNPEYLRADTAVKDSRYPWTILIGEHDKKSGKALDILYKKFKCPIYHCSLKEAEMQKYVHNLYNAVKITFFNEMREVGKNIDVDTEKIFKITAESCEGIWNPKYGIRDFGPFDGFCLPKDTKAFYEWASKKGLDVSLLKTTIDVNNKLMEKVKTGKQYNALEL